MTATIPLFQAPDAASAIVDVAEWMADQCSQFFEEITGQPNRLDVAYSKPGEHVPVCCIGRNSANYWTLEVNDGEAIDHDQRSELATRLIKTRLPCCGEAWKNSDWDERAGGALHCPRCGRHIASFRQ